MENLDRRLLLAGAGLAGAAALSKLAHAGPLNPPVGVVASTGKTTQEMFDRLDKTLALMPLVAPYVTVGAGGGVTINNKGSYYLPSNLTVTSGAAITVNADCQINLNGFMIDASATNSAVVAGPGGPRVSVFGGRIMGTGTQGAGTSPLVDLRSAIRADFFDVYSSFSGGVHVAAGDLNGDGCTFQGSGTGADQVQCQSGTINNCTFSSPAGRAIAQVAVAGATLLPNRLIVSRCNIISPVGNAIELLSPGIVHECTIGPRNGGGNLSAANGIVLNGGGIVSDCAIDQCGQFGIVGMGRMPRIENNRIFGCGMGGILVRDSATIATSGALIEGNHCGGSSAVNAVGIKIAAAVQPGGNNGHLVTSNYCTQNWRNLEIGAAFNFAFSNRLAFQGGGGHTLFGANVAYGPAVAGSGDLSLIPNALQFGTNLTF